MFELIPKPEAIIGERPNTESVKPPSVSQIPLRYTWREWFSRNQTVPVDSDTEDALDGPEDVTDENN